MVISPSHITRALACAATRKRPVYLEIPRDMVRATIDDPTIYTRPWTFEASWERVPGPLYEFACHEGNYALQDILRGARRQDKAASGQ